MADKQPIYTMNKWFGGQSENEFLSSGSDFASSSNINIYESPKSIELSKAFSKLLGSSILYDSTSLGAGSVGSSTLIQGVVITCKASKQITIEKKSTCTATLGIILDRNTKSLLAMNIFSGNLCTFPGYSLTSGTDYIVGCYGGDGVSYSSITEAATYPQTGSNVDFVAGYDGSAEDTNNVYNITKIGVPSTFFTTNGYVTKIIRLPNDIQSNAYLTSTGEIYIDSGSGPVLKHTITKTDKFILNAVCFTSFLLVFTSTEIHRISFTGNDFKTFASCAESILSFTGSYQGFSANESKDLPIYNFKDTLLYFASGNKLFSVGNTLSAVSTSETLRIGSKIVGLSFLNSNLKIYVNYLNVSSSLYFWNEVSSDSIDYTNRVFKSALTDGQLDYVVCNDGLYIYNGYSGEKLFNFDFSDFGKSGSNYFVPQNMMSIDSYFWYVVFNKNIYKFGRKFTNLGNAFSVYAVEDNNITAISDKISLSSVLYYADDTKTIAKESTSYKTEGTMDGIAFFGDSMEKVKKVDRIFDAFECPNGCSIEMSFFIDGSTTPTAVKYTIDDTTTKKYKEIFENELQNLKNHRIIPRIVLKGNGINTPKLYEHTIIMNYIENN